MVFRDRITTTLPEIVLETCRMKLFVNLAVVISLSAVQSAFGIEASDPDDTNIPQSAVDDCQNCRDADDSRVVAGDSSGPIAGTAEYHEAMDLFKAEKYEEARRAFKMVSKKFKKSEIREDALFMQAESAWQQDHYAVAHDVYAILLEKEYPSTKHLSVVSKRLFKAGALWLDFPEVVKRGEIHLDHLDQSSRRVPSEEPPKLPNDKPLLVPNFKNNKEPLFDASGYGLAALIAVWMNDPTGPLADDAMLLVASYHARTGNYGEADRYFEMLRETFPDSPFAERAMIHERDDFHDCDTPALHNLR